MRKILGLVLCAFLVLAQTFSVRTTASAAGTTAVSLGKTTMAAAGAVRAFPGAQGYGAYATGGRGGEVYEVTNLNDSGPGSLRDAVSQPNRTVVFRVSGTIELQRELTIASNITIAGQTAPGGGITVKGYPTSIRGSNVIVRYIRFRLGSENGIRSDSLDINYANNVIIDHCSISWGVDENFSAYDNNNVTVQWCMITEGLNNVNHSCGGLWGPTSSYHHNLFAHNKTRNPKLGYLAGEALDFRNNVLYNWGEMSVYTGTQGTINIINNYYKPGPSTKSSVASTIVDPDPTNQIYVSGNYVYGNPAVTANNWLGVTGDCIRVYSPFDVPAVTTHTAQEAYNLVLAEAGASRPMRDAVDTRIINEIINGTGSIINTENDVGGYPVLNSTTPPTDSDHDGMPDDWERANGLNPYNPEDRNYDADGDGYTNLEEYLNSLAHPGLEDPPEEYDPEPVFYFDFGPGNLASGYTKVTRTTMYSPVTGYGLVGSGIDERNRSGPNDLLRDFVVANQFEFRADIPNGNYTVTIYSGDQIATQAPFNVTAEGVLVLQNVSAASGQFAVRSFNVTVTDGQLNVEFSGNTVRLNALEIDPL